MLFDKSYSKPLTSFEDLILKDALTAESHLLKQRQSFDSQLLKSGIVDGPNLFLGDSKNFTNHFVRNI